MWKSISNSPQKVMNCRPSFLKTLKSESINSFIGRDPIIMKSPITAADVHEQSGISFITPPFFDKYMEETVMVIFLLNFSRYSHVTFSYFLVQSIQSKFQYLYCFELLFTFHFTDTHILIQT